MADETKSAVDAGMLIGAPHQIGSAAFATLPMGAQLIDLEKYLVVPPYAKGTVIARTAASLVDYCKRHRTDNSAIFADVQTGSVTAVIDYFSAGNDAAHKAHQCVYTAPFSEEWNRWTAISGRKMSQTDFALFIEENRDDVVNPDGATMLELAKTLDVKKKVTFKSGIRLDNGSVSLDYIDDAAATGGIGGKLAIPTEVEIGIPVFYGGDRYKITAFFRYRIEDGKLVLWVDVHRIKHIRDAAFNDIISKVSDGVEGVPVYEAALG